MKIKSKLYYQLFKHLQSYSTVDCIPQKYKKILVIGLWRQTTIIQKAYFSTHLRESTWWLQKT